MKLGVLGTGSIAHTVISGVCRLEEIQCTAVAARDLERARSFAGEFGFRRAYGSYLEFKTDTPVFTICEMKKDNTILFIFASAMVVLVLAAAVVLIRKKRK